MYSILNTHFYFHAVQKNFKLGYFFVAEVYVFHLLGNTAASTGKMDRGGHAGLMELLGIDSEARKPYLPLL